MNRECFFLRHEELNSRFIVMTIDEVTWDRPKIGTGFSVICGFCRLRLSSFCCTICKWEYEFIIFSSDQYFFRVDSSRITIRCIQFSESSKSRNQNISFPNSSPRSAHILERFPSFMQSFPFCQEVLDVSQIAKAFHRVRPPRFIQARF